MQMMLDFYCALDFREDKMSARVYPERAEKDCSCSWGINRLLTLAAIADVEMGCEGFRFLAAVGMQVLWCSCHSRVYIEPQNVEKLLSQQLICPASFSNATQYVRRRLCILDLRLPAITASRSLIL
jgi:hypothetical protein